MNSSLEELQNCVWKKPEYNSALITNCHRLRKIPLKDLSIENIRMLVGQKIGLKYLVPLALESLENNYFCSGDFYNGDLLYAVLGIESDYWDKNYILFQRLSAIMFDLEEDYKTYSEKILPKWEKLFNKVILINYYI